MKRIALYSAALLSYAPFAYAQAPSIVYPITAGTIANTLGAANAVSTHAPTIGLATDQLASILAAMASPTVNQGTAGTSPWQVTCISGCLSGGGGLAQGNGASSNPWIMQLWQGGSASDTNHPIFTAPGAGLTWPVSIASQPLPTGASTAANQTGGNQKTQIVDGSGNVIASTSNNLNVLCANCSGTGASAADGASFTAGVSLFSANGGFFQTTPTANPLTTGQQGMQQFTAQRAGFVNLRNSSGTEIATSGAPLRIDPTGTTPQPVTGTFWQATQPVSGTFWQATQPVSLASQPLPTGASTAANQAPVASITAPTAPPSGGTMVMGSATTNAPTDTNGNAYPLSLTTTGQLRVADSAIITALGSPFQSGGSIANTSFGISGTLPAFAATPTFNLGTLNGAALATNQTGGNQKTQIVDGSGNVIGSTSNNLNVLCANCTGSGVSAVDGASFTAGSSLFATVGGMYQTTPTNNPLVTGGQGATQLTQFRALHSNLRNASGVETGTASTPLRIDPVGTTPQPVSGTFWQATQPVSGTFWQATQPISAAALPLPSGAATSALQPPLASIATPAAPPAAGGIMMMGSASTGLPTDTSGNAYPLSMTVSGQLRVFDTNISAQLPTNASVTTPAALAGTGIVGMGSVTTAAPTYPTGDSAPFSMTTSGSLRVADPSVVTALGSPFQTGGSIGNTGFNVTGPLGTQAIGSAVAVTPATSSSWSVTCASGCGSTGTVSNAGNLANSNTNLGTVGYQYNASSGGWVPQTADASGNVNVNINNGAILGFAPGVVASGNNLIGQASGEQHVGEYGVNTGTINSSALGVTAISHATGSCIGTLVTFSNAARVSGTILTSGTGGTINNAIIGFTSASVPVSMDAIFFTSNPASNPCPSDGSAFNLAAADVGKLATDVIHLNNTTNLTASSTSNILSATGRLMYGLSSSTTLYAVLVNRGTAFTPATGTTFQIGLQRE